MPDAPDFDGPALERWMEAWRFNPTDLSQRLGISLQTLWNWRQSPEPLKPWVKLALAGIERDERRRTVEGA